VRRFIDGVLITVLDTFVKLFWHRKMEAINALVLVIGVSFISK
jgi:hypothetical protein